MKKGKEKESAKKVEISVDFWYPGWYYIQAPKKREQRSDERLKKIRKKFLTLRASPDII